MIQTKLLASSNGNEFIDAINNFVKDKKVIDIKYQSMAIPVKFKNGLPAETDINDRALIIYEIEE